VLIAAAAASALPGSPVRGWVGSLLTRGEEPVAATPTEATPEMATPGTTTGDAGIRVSISPPVRVRVLGLAPGDDVTVQWVRGGEVAVFAPSGSRFSSGEEGVEVLVSHGPVRIELPMNVWPLTLEVGARVWLRSLESGVEHLVHPEVEADGTLRYVTPAEGQR